MANGQGGAGSAGGLSPVPAPNFERRPCPQRPARPPFLLLRRGGRGRRRPVYADRADGHGQDAGAAQLCPAPAQAPHHHCAALSVAHRAERPRIRPHHPGHPRRSQPAGIRRRTPRVLRPLGASLHHHHVRALFRGPVPLAARRFAQAAQHRPKRDRLRRGAEPAGTADAGHAARRGRIVRALWLQRRLFHRHPAELRRAPGCRMEAPGDLPLERVALRGAAPHAGKVARAEANAAGGSRRGDGRVRKASVASSTCAGTRRGSTNSLRTSARRRSAFS